MDFDIIQYMARIDSESLKVNNKRVQIGLYAV